MLTPFEFLKQELDNVDRCLKESLRHEYGAARGAEFFDECSRRLEALRGLLYVAKDDSAQIATLCNQASKLSELITRIERSHLGEFSWAFAGEIRGLAEKACQDASGTDPAKPLFFFSSDGGLGAYRIHREQTIYEPVKVRIFNIVFPRTFKHHVLLHPILGHEVGHAAMFVPHTQSHAQVVDTELFRGTALESPATFRAWLPQLIDKKIVDQLSDEALTDIGNSWRAEFFCDLFGFLLMGPCFVGAHRTVLAPHDPDGRKPGQAHPPGLCRYWLLRAAALETAWHKPSPKLPENVRRALDDYWSPLLSTQAKEPWIAIFPEQQVRAAVRAFQKVSANLGGHFFSDGSIAELPELCDQLLNRVPPVGRQKFKEGTGLREIDFRTVLYAGWVAWMANQETAGDERISFFEMNRLCDQAILQQQAISRQLRPRSSPK